MDYKHIYRQLDNASLGHEDSKTWVMAHLNEIAEAFLDCLAMQDSCSVLEDRIYDLEDQISDLEEELRGHE